MKTLHRYLFRQVVVTLLMTGAVFTFVLLLANLLREILPLLLNRHATLLLIFQALGLLVPWVWVFALPMGMMTTMLLVFGRFSADQELTAARASGVSLLSLALPIMVLSVVLCGISALVNLEIAPRCRVAYNDLRFNLRGALAEMPLAEGRPIYDFPGHIVYITRIRNDDLQKVLVYKLKDETSLEWTLRADRGRIERDKANQKIILHLYDAQMLYFSAQMPVSVAEVPIELDLRSIGRKGNRLSLRDMTFSELMDELRSLERRLGQAPPAARVSSEEAQNRRRMLQRQREDITEPVRVQIHRRLAFSFACFGFTLVGIPLGIRIHRRETNIGMFVGLILVMGYYGLTVAFASLSDRPELAPHLLVWLPNFLFQAIGAVLLWRANRGGG